jgi:hypothetical protein
MPEPLRVAALDFGRGKHLGKLAAPEIARRLHEKGFRARKQVSAVSIVDRPDQAHHERRKRQIDVRAAPHRIF